ncbi:MAG: tRNA (adenosine(37)-N6)-threonylcarbamoyltransferase complex ATPase subunit type 1 TsaE [Clostridia bacterium]|nr:MAG: tRNA (adenosine(37)-N6)-threonylcarbamoyltransferase complex ATPase subunit type 1 TsaE [Clostridia bacterium]
MREAVLTVITDRAEETRNMGRVLGRLLQPGDVVLLSGELGSGKTVFAQGVAAGLEVEGPVTSPSFVLMNRYPGRLTLYHLDLYRLDHDGAADLGLEEFLGSEGVAVVEWPEVLPSHLLTDYVQVTLKWLGPDARELTFWPAGARAEKLIREFKKAWSLE